MNAYATRRRRNDAARARAAATSGASLTESDFQRQVSELLNAHGWRWYHVHDSRRTWAGWPDIVAVKGERMLALELKTESGKVTEAQYEWLAALARVEGVECYVVRPRNLDELAVIVAR